MIEIVIDGTDGAGKTTLLKIVKRHLEELDFSVQACAPFRIEEVYHLWNSNPIRASTIIVEIMAKFRGDANNADVILWDRGWPTAYISTDNEIARALFYPFPHLTLLLAGTIERTRRKTQECNLQGKWVRDEDLVRLYNNAYHKLESPDDCEMLRVYPGKDELFPFGEIARIAESLVVCDRKMGVDRAR